MELVSPAGNLPALEAALDAGADAIYTGFRDQTNARAPSPASTSATVICNAASARRMLQVERSTSP